MTRETGEPAVRPQGAHLFRFAVLTDTHVNHAEHETTSPWPVNRLANGRVRHAIRTIKSFAPAFVVHVGDMVHPVPTQPRYVEAVARFREITAELDCALHVTPGNHDIGDKPIAWSPAAAMTEETLAIYQRQFGATFHGFDHAGCRFMVLNSLLINSGLAAEREQAMWFERELAQISARSARSFLFLHDPPFTTARDEPVSYDNLAEPGRGWLLDLVARYQVEAVFSGHVHNFWYNRHGRAELYILPSTTFVRQDYAELYRVEPGPENGRNDPAKLGFAIVDVFERGHVVHVVRTNGASQAATDAIMPRVSLPLVHTKSAPPSPVGVDLRHPWAEVREIAPSSGVDEFGRKRARNDYPIQALWEMGLARLRVPLQDLAHEATRARMRLMRDIGHSFTVYSYDVPAGTDRSMILAHSDLVAALEIVLPAELIGERIAALGSLRKDGAPPVLLSTLIKPHHGPSHGVFAHAINHGFRVEDDQEIAALLSATDVRESVSGLVFRIGRRSDPLPALTRIAELAAGLNIRAEVHVRLAGDDPAEALTDDLANACRVAETLIAARQLGPRMTVLLDTFEDVDRSFFARTGLVDRRCNPRAAAHVFRSLRGVDPLLGSGSAEVQDNGPDLRTIRAVSGRWLLVLPSVPAMRDMTWLASRLYAGDAGIIVCTDLVTGARLELQSRPATDEPGSDGGGSLRLNGPSLFHISRPM